MTKLDIWRVGSPGGKRFEVHGCLDGDITTTATLAEARRLLAEHVGPGKRNPRGFLWDALEDIEVR